MDALDQTAGVGSEDANFDATWQTYANDSGNTVQEATSTPSAGSVTVSQIFGFFNIMVGLMLVAGLLLFFGGFIAYLTRLGLESRMQGLRYMYYGLSVLFVLIVVLGVVQYIQVNPTVVFMVVAVLVVIFGGIALVRAWQDSGSDEDEH